MIVYISENKINGKCYVGQTRVNLPNRKSQHKFHSIHNTSNSLFHKAIKEYGWENFEWRVLCKCTSDDELDKKELDYIKKLNTLRPNGYNMTTNKHGYLGTSLKGKNNPRYNDHRTFEEIHGKEKAEEIKRKLRETFTKERLESMREFTSKMMKLNNPMNNEESRKKLSKTRTGGNNPASIYDWIFITPLGGVYYTDCLREFCRKNKTLQRGVLGKMHKEEFMKKTIKYKGWKCIKNLKENLKN
jgi:group I intron endonuclease